MYNEIYDAIDEAKTIMTRGQFDDFIYELENAGYRWSDVEHRFVTYTGEVDTLMLDDIALGRMTIRDLVY